MASFGNSPNFWLVLLTLKLTFLPCATTTVVHDMQGQSVARLLDNSPAPHLLLLPRWNGFDPLSPYTIPPISKLHVL